MRSGRLTRAMVLAATVALCPIIGYAQEALPENTEKQDGQLTFRRTAREYGGRAVEGEDRIVGPGDSVWRMLVKERGVPKKQFSQYLVVIRGLNPQIKNVDILRVGETIFIPLRPEELVGSQPEMAAKPVARAPLRGTTKEYRVKAGQHLYQILREQLGLQSERELAIHYALTKDLNPEKMNWDVLLDGEVIRLPVPPPAEQVASAKSKTPVSEIAPPETKAPAPEVASKPTKVGEVVASAPATKLPQKDLGSATLKETKPGGRASLDYATKIRARENVALLTQVLEALGNEVQRGGQEVFALSDGTIRLDKDAFPVIYSPQLRQKVILDIEDGIPPSVRSKLADGAVPTPVMPVSQDASLQAAVNQLLSGLGYQPLPGDRPVVISDGGVALEVKGNWVVLAPEQNNKIQEVFVVTLSERADEIPEYLKTALSQKGLHLRDVVVPAAPGLALDGNKEAKEPRSTVRRWPDDKRDLVDALLTSFGIPFKAGQALSVELRPGLRMEFKGDRMFEANGKRRTLVFHRVEPELKRALQEKQGLTVYELDISRLARKEIVARLLTEIGEQGAYREHRFAAANGPNKDRMNIAAWGFLLPNRGMFVTDREIPQSLHRFFFEKGLEIVYFQ